MLDAKPIIGIENNINHDSNSISGSSVKIVKREPNIDLSRKNMFSEYNHEDAITVSRHTLMLSDSENVLHHTVLH